MIDRTKEFEPIFCPKSVAVVGSFSSPAKGGYQYFSNLIRAKYKGKYYAVSATDKDALGEKCYRSILDIPGPVDLVEFCVPASASLGLLEECRQKGITAVEMFTAGFSESGTAEGRLLEAELVKKAKKAGIHIVGPNCIGVYNPSINLPCGPSPYMGEPGDVAFLSQSGGNTARTLKAGMVRKLGFSKAVSYGNGCDLDSSDYLEYFTLDKQTRIIGAYIEGVRDGRRFFNVLKEAAARKPVVVVKGGQTEAGAIAAASHTGSLASSYSVWKTAVKQAGAILVDNMDETIDTLIALDRIPKIRGNVALVAGTAAGGGGDSVISSDACMKQGLTVPAFTPETKRRLESFMNWPGVITRNPLDLSGLGGNIQTLDFALKAVGDDTATDIICLQVHVDDAVRVWQQRAGMDSGVDMILNIIKDFAKTSKKPVIAVLTHGLAEMERVKFEEALCQAGIATFPTIERATKALSNVVSYYDRRSD